MSEDGLLLSGDRDIYSSGAEDGFVSTADHDERYYTPNTQINRTKAYNEMDFARIQDGKKKQPDYIIVFREDGKIQHMEEAEKAQEQWCGLPIVVVDKDKCLEAEKQKVENMMERYNNGEKHLAGEIWQKVRNNRVTAETMNKEFCEEVNMEKLKKEAELQKQQEEEQKENESEQYKETKENNKQIKRTKGEVEIDDLEQNYDKTTPQERKQEVSKIRRINIQIQQVVNEKEGEEVGK